MMFHFDASTVRCIIAPVVIAAVCAACAAETGEPDPGEIAGSDGPPGKSTQSLGTCQGQSCDGILPLDSPCKSDMIDTLVGAPIRNTAGAIIGGIGLFRSPSCQTVWAASTFYENGGPRNYRLCTVRVRAAHNDPSCFDYANSFGSDPLMKFESSGKTVFGKITVDGITTRTPEFTVP